MPHFFKHFPTVQYDVKKNNKPIELTNLTVRFKLQEVIQNRASIFYDYSIKESDRPDTIAHRYYNDDTLGWIILLTNQIIDPFYDWPLNSGDFDNYIIGKYGSVNSALNTTHHYEKIIRSGSIHTDGSIIKEFAVEVDETTYNTLNENQRRTRSNYEYEEELNEARREIKILDKSFVPSLLGQFRTVLQ